MLMWKDAVYLRKLPFTSLYMLRHIVMHLDGATLWPFSYVNKGLQNVCKNTICFVLICDSLLENYHDGWDFLIKRTPWSKKCVSWWPKFYNRSRVREARKYGWARECEMKELCAMVQMKANIYNMAPVDKCPLD